MEDPVSEQQPETLTGYLNSNVLENKIKFTRETSKNELVFLDTKVHLKDGFLISEIYSKPTDSHEYLNPRSCHPTQVTRNNPYSVALRVRRNCSDRVPGDRMFINNLVKYKAYLLGSGYASDTIDKHFIKVAKLKRKDTLGEKVARNRKSRNRKINFVTSWDPMFPDINKAFRKFYHILEEERTVQEREKYESILCFESGLIHTLLNLAQQFTRFRKHHFADGQNDLVSPDLQHK